MVDLFKHLHGRTFQTTQEAEDEWLDACNVIGDQLLFRKNGQ
jgi:hypothetical protein